MSTNEKPTILIIDDSEQITRLLHGILSREGYHVVVSNDPQRGQQLITAETPDLVVLDICMPGLDGWELCRRIRQEFPVPILFLTVLAEGHHVEQAFRAGADSYMTKPFSLVDFLTRVRTLLRENVQRLDA